MLFPPGILCSFLFAQKRTKNGSRSLVPPEADFPALLEFIGSLKTRFSQTV
jgi:hypothetical protein